MKKFFKIFAVAAVFFSCAVAFATELSNSGFVFAEATLYPNGQDLNHMNRAVELLAYRNLAEQVGELKISSSSTIQEFKLTSDDIKANVDKAINGAKIVEKKRNPDGSFYAKVRLQVFGGNNSLANAVLPEDVQVEEIPKPKFTNLESGNFNQNYTGLIVDCRGKEISTAIVPAIKSMSGEKIYSYEQVSRQTAVSMGIVDYADSIESGAERAGSNPLIVKAVKVSGECDAIVSADDANKILAANQSTNFLNNCMVVFVR